MSSEDCKDIEKVAWMESNWNDIANISQHMCRICSNLSELLMPIFDGEGVEQELYSKIQRYLPIKIRETDKLPLNVCYQCAATIISWDSLVLSCVETDRKLRALALLDGSEEKESADESDGNYLGLDETRAIDSDDEPLINQAATAAPLTTEHNPTEKFVKSKRKRSTPQKLKGMDEKDKAEPDMAYKDQKVEFSLLNVKTEIEDYEETKPKDPSISDSWSCFICAATFRDAATLSRHVKRHDKKEPLNSSGIEVCNYCGNIYKTKTNLRKHILLEHKTNQTQCPVCKISVHVKKIEAHLKSAHGVKTETDEENKFQCKHCPKWFKNKFIRNSHVKEVHLNIQTKCKLCGFEGNRTVVKRHKREVHCVKKFPCHVCDVPFKTMHTLKLHMTTHSDLRCYTCDVCGMGFKRLNNVQDHMKCHEQKSNQCQICGNFFTRKRYLAIHEQTIHNFYADGNVPEEKGFECSTCGAKLKWKKNLLAHMRIHTGEKPYTCKICKTGFICHGSLRTHMTKHDICTKVEKSDEFFSSPSLPTKHELSHESQIHPHLGLEMHCF